MLQHFAREIDPIVARRILDAARQAIESGDASPYREEASRLWRERSKRAKEVVVTLSRDQRTELMRSVMSVLGFSEGRADSIVPSTVEVEVLQTMKRVIARHHTVTALAGPEFLLADIRELLEELLSQSTATASLAGADAEGDAREDEAEFTAADVLRRVGADLVDVGRAIGAEDVGLGADFEKLDVYQQFVREHPDAGSFWSVHATDDRSPIEVFPHDAWTGGPCALPNAIALAGIKLTVDSADGPLSYALGADLATWIESARRGAPELRLLAVAASEVARRGNALASWVAYVP
jgi:hypothetical protein